MTYKLYTYPNCHVCHDIKDFLKERGIEYGEVNLADNNGRKEFSEIYGKYKNTGGVLRRDDKKMTILPVLVQSNGQGIERLVQGEEIIELFEGSSVKTECPADCAYSEAD